MLGFLFQSEYYIDVLNKLLISFSIGFILEEL